MTGTVADTYVAALQHDLADVPDGATLLGVVRRPTPWFHAAVDDNRPALAPPADLLDDHARRQEELEADGLADAAAHDEAWAAVDFDARYREHLRSDDAAQAALSGLRERVAGGESVALVCFENTDEKRCHRTILRDVVVER